MTKTNKVVTILRRDWQSNGGKVFALFPAMEHCAGECVVYEDGQHGGADYRGCIANSTPADTSSPDVAALVRELNARGYDLNIRKRFKS